MPTNCPQLVNKRVPDKPSKKCDTIRVTSWQETMPASKVTTNSTVNSQEQKIMDPLKMIMDEAILAPKMPNHTPC